MKITPLELREYRFKKVFRGYDPTEVDTIKDILSETLEGLVREIKDLDTELTANRKRLEELMENEKLLKDTMTTAQQATEDIKESARKEAELIISEARLKAEQILQDAHNRFTKIQDDIEQLKKQRFQLESEIKAVIDYHQRILFSEEEKRRTEEKVTFIK